MNVLTCFLQIFNDFSYFLEKADLTPQELEFLKQEYGIEDEETTEA